MTDEVEPAVEIPAPELEATAVTPEPVVPETPVVEAPKTFTQEELDAAIGKRLAREQRKWERDRQPAPVVDLPKQDQFESVDAYAEALVQKKLDQREQLKAQNEVLEQYHDKEDEARTKYEDFEQVAYNPKLKITQVMAETIQASDMGPDVAYYLGTNPKEAERISKLAPFVQAKEIGRIEAKIAADPPVKKTSSAPAPFQAVTPRGAPVPSYDTTDPRSIKTMSTSEWINAERARQTKEWEKAHR
jgi:hypothetical protein